MLVENLPFFLSLVFVIIFVIVLASKINIAYPILLVVAGLVISFIPEAPELHVDPDIIFHIFLPPLLFEASWAVSWKQLWRWRRVVSVFAFLIVFLTAGLVAIITSSLIPGFTIALGFLLGAIVSPPDAVSAGAIMKHVKVPKRVSTLLEGESLLNDASALIILRFAVIAIVTGQFVLVDATVTFVWMVVGGVGCGLGLAYIFMNIHKHLTADINVHVILTFITPFVMYMVAEQLGASGVLSVVSGGLFLSANRQKYLNASSRLRGINVWDSIILLLNGIVFILIGLELPDIMHGLQADGTSLKAAIGYGLLVTAVLIIGRIVSAYGMVGATMIAKHFIKVEDGNNPGWKIPLLIGWSGMRGVVSLAAALSIPLQLADGSDFPYRNLILFITFVVILLTLLLQGLTLPWLIKWLQVKDPDGEIIESEEFNKLQKRLAEHTIIYLKSKYQDKMERHPELERVISGMQKEVELREVRPISFEDKVLYFDILNEQRRWLMKRNTKDRELDDESVRKSLNYLDLKEAKLRFE